MQRSLRQTGQRPDLQGQVALPSAHRKPVSHQAEHGFMKRRLRQRTHGVAQDREVPVYVEDGSFARTAPEHKPESLDERPPPEGPGTDGWGVLVGLSALVTLICSVDRAAMSVSILPMSTDFGWGDEVKGAVSSAFFAGYTVTNLVGGVLATRYPPKLLLALGVAAWSLCTIATPAAAASGHLEWLLACRVFMGLGEGITFPCIQNLVAANVPPSRKPRSLTLIYAGIQSGTIVSLLAAPFIIREAGWPSVFYIFGTVGFVWLTAWQPLAKDAAHPPNSAAAETSIAGSADQRQLSMSDAQPDASHSRKADASTSGRQPGSQVAGAAAGSNFDFRSVPWRAVLRNKPFLAILIAHAGWGFGHAICFAWLPAYYAAEYGLNVQDSAWLSALPWICTVGVTLAGGGIGDALVGRGVLTRQEVRKLFQIVGMVGPAACLLYLAAAANHSTPALSINGAVGLMCATLALGGLTSNGHASNHQDLTVRYTGILFGMTNSASSLAGTGSTYATGLVLNATHSWALVFETVALVYVASAAVYAAWASADNQFDDVPTGTVQPVLRE